MAALTIGLVAVLMAASAKDAVDPPLGAPAAHGCAPPLDSKPWCDRTLPLARRSELLVSELTVPELISQMSGGMPAVARLGVPAYHYGYEALRGSRGLQSAFTRRSVCLYGKNH